MHGLTRNFAVKITPRMSIVLATDSYATIRPVIRCLSKQTVKETLEVVLVTPDTNSMRANLAGNDPFAATTIVQDSVDDLAVARAAGVRASSAPIIFIGETHSFPAPNMAELILDAFQESDWACVVPSVYNANPHGSLSWSGLILDYGRWAPGLPAGRLADAPVYNAAFQSRVLLALGDRLRFALGQTDELALALAANRENVLFEPRAGIGHVNITRFGPWFLNRFFVGNLIATNRSRQWPLTKRVIYAGGSFLIPLVLFGRLSSGIRQTVRNQALPFGTLPAIVVGLVLRAAGEAFGYAGLLTKRAARGMHNCEMHKLKYARYVSA
jgi:hypothetical protein